jgi:hypothetical protein
MPSTSAKQHRFMEAVAHNPSFAKKAGVPQNVGQEFSKADKGRTFKQGGKTMANTSRMNRLEELGRVDSEKASTKKGKHNLMAEKKRIVKEVKMAKGGMTTGKHGVAEKSGITTAKMGKAEVGGKLKHGEHTIQKRGHTRALEPKMGAGKPLGMKHGGRAHKK